MEGWDCNLYLNRIISHFAVSHWSAAEMGYVLYISKIWRQRCQMTDQEEIINVWRENILYKYTFIQVLYFIP